MIKSIHIKNFRQHKDLKFNFHPGLNIIAGPTGSGKSASLRALRFATRNKPQGDSIFPKGMKSPLTEVDVKIPGHSISRMKSKNVNSYILNEVELKSFRNDLPKEIQNILNLEDFNFQLQYDRHFLLDDSAGEVAVKLNEVANLTIIDESIKKAREIIDQANKEITFMDESIGINEQEIKNLQLFEIEQKDVTDLLGQYALIESAEEDVAEVQSLIFNIYDLHDQMQEEKNLIQYEEVVQQLIMLENNIDYMEKEVQEITQLKNQLKTVYNLMMVQNTIISNEKEVKDLLDLSDEINKSAGVLQTIQEYINQIIELSDDIDVHQKDVDLLDKRYENLKIKAKVCPVCLKPF